MPRYPSTRELSYSFGPGPLPPAIRALIIANAVMFVIRLLFPEITLFFGLRPSAVIEQLRLWQPVTYMFLHAGLFHILFNMLALWMFGTELERMWGTRSFVWYYFATGLGAGVSTLVVALLPFRFADSVYDAVTIGASGAIYGVLLAYGLYFPRRPIYLYFIFPIPAKYFVMLMGAIALLSSIGESGGSGVAHVAHLGGLVAGYLILRRGQIHPIAELKYRYLRWKFGRAKRRFDVHTGGRRDDWDRRIH
jgi:membrane associated rhomboid family serine protease